MAHWALDGVRSVRYAAVELEHEAELLPRKEVAMPNVLAHDAACTPELREGAITFTLHVRPLEWDNVNVEISEGCNVCGTQMVYARETMSRYTFERRWTYRLRVWWATFCHRTGMWDQEDPPF